MRRADLRNLILMALPVAVAACINHVDVQCGQDSDCNLNAGGVCAAAAGTDNKWCAYPDLNCPNGYRYSTLDVGDGVSGACVPMMEVALPQASCIALPQTCGASHNDDCCDSPSVSGGMYYRSYDVAHDSLSGDMNSPAAISSFRLDKYEVTVGRFRAFVADGQGDAEKAPSYWRWSAS